MTGWTSAWDFEEPDNSPAEDRLADDPFAAPGEPAGLPVSKAPVRSDQSMQPSAAPMAAPALPVFSVRPQKCRSGLMCWRGAFTDAASLIAPLAGVAPLLLIARPDILPELPDGPEEPQPADGAPPPVEIPADRPPVLNWFPPATAAVASPALYVPENAAATTGILSAAWGGDAAVLMLTSLAPEDALIHLRGAIRGDDGTSTAPPAGVRMFYTPAGARSLLTDAPAEFVEPLMQGVTGMLMEADDPAEWLLFTSRDQVAAFGSILG